LENITDFFI